jgi:hypothetical protein
MDVKLHLPPGHKISIMNEFERMCKVAGIAQIGVLSRHLHEGTEKKNQLVPGVQAEILIRD